MGLLRILLAYAVIIAHSNPFFGFVGIRDHAVPAFFIISGFYMQLVLGERYDGENGLKRFYINRALRIMPGYWTVLLMVIAIALCGDGHIDILAKMHLQAANALHLATDGSPGSLIMAIPNLFIIGADVARVFCTSGSTGHLVLERASNPDCYSTYHYMILPQTWSLSAELIFYIVAPFFSRLDKKSILLWMFAIERFGLWSANFHISSSNFLFWSNMDFFLLGMLIGKINDSTGVLKTRWASPLALFPFVIFAFYPQIDARVDYNGLWLMWFVFSLGVAVLFERTRSWTWDRVVGELSYSVYLVHWQFAWPMWDFGPYAAGVTAIVSTSVAILIVLGVERPIHRYRRRLSVKRVTTHGPATNAA